MVGKLGTPRLRRPLCGRGAPGRTRARQVADRFHLPKNFREAVERQLGRFEAPLRG
jgi:hypothetical protein